MTKFRAYEEMAGRGVVRVVLEAPNASAAIFPGKGFNLYSWIIEGREIFVPREHYTENSTTYGVPILFPTPNRVENAVYTWNGKTYTQIKHGEPRVIHGLSYDSPFTYTYGADDDCAWCEGVFTIRKEDEIYQGYPFECTLRVKIVFTGRSFKLTYAVTNDGDEVQPYGFALHPYFRVMGDKKDVEIQVPAPCYYEANACIPTGKLLPAEGEFDISSFKSLDTSRFDTVYHGMDSSKVSTIHYKEWGKKLTLQATDDFVNAVVWTPPMPCFAIENQTNATNYLNLYAKGLKEESAIQLLDPAETRKGSVTFTVIDD
ncbi:MAG: aldose 1-epimerase [Clostridia bacterium]|nr:aldose 1-epimerase [Clostridia bacterium]